MAGCSVDESYKDGSGSEDGIYQADSLALCGGDRLAIADDFSTDCLVLSQSIVLFSPLSKSVFGDQSISLVDLLVSGRRRLWSPLGKGWKRIASCPEMAVDQSIP